MKRVAILGLTGLFLLTGCGNKVTCKGTDKVDGSKVSVKVTAELESKKVESISAVMKFDDETVAKQYCSKLKFYVGDLAKCDGKEVKIENYNKVSNGNMVGKTKKEFKNYMKEVGYSCK